MLKIFALSSVMFLFPATGFVSEQVVQLPILTHPVAVSVETI